MVLSGIPSVPAVVRFPIGLVGAALALLVMDRVMARLPEGETPPNVAAGVLTDTPADGAHPRLAAAAHYFAGFGTGLLFVYGSLLSEAGFDGASAMSIAVTAAVLYALMVGFFIAVPLPRARGVSGTRRPVIARDWSIAAAAYLAVLVPVVTVLTLLVA